MASELETVYRPLLEACSFAARAHGSQLRKDGETPYVSHAFRVCLVARDVFGIEDHKVLTAAVLHDVVEDTTKDFDDLSEAFGEEVARWVAALSKDKRLPETEREDAYAKQLAQAPWQVQVCKLADIFDNLMDSIHTRPKQQARTCKNSRRYLEALRSNLQEPARRPWEIVSELLAGMESQERRAGKK
jgi:guanosine-3',5'-bis(diphosphate) 3'-pyrophosphohydrolase